VSAHLEAATATARRLGDVFILGYCHQERGWAAVAHGRYAEAEREFRGMLAVLDGIGQGTGVAGAHEALGEIAARHGRHRAAREHFAEAAARCRQRAAA
jgi:hypothetical protein